MTSAAKSFYFNPRCLFCDKNNKRRHTKRGEHWVCVHCGERNPGPSMIRAMVARLTDDQTPGRVPLTPTQTVDVNPPKLAATKINSAVAEAVPSKPSKKPAIVKKAAPVAAVPAATEPAKRDWVFG